MQRERMGHTAFHSGSAEPIGQPVGTQKASAANCLYKLICGAGRWIAVSKHSELVTHHRLSTDGWTVDTYCARERWIMLTLALRDR